MVMGAARGANDVVVGVPESPAYISLLSLNNLPSFVFDKPGANSIPHFHLLRFLTCIGIASLAGNFSSIAGWAIVATEEDAESATLSFDAGFIACGEADVFDKGFKEVAGV